MSSTTNKATASTSEALSRSERAAHWLEQHGDFLFRRAMLIIGRREVAEDLVQDTLLAAYESFDSFKGQASEKTWLATILRNKAIDYLRRAARRELPTDFSDSKEGDDPHFNSWGIWTEKGEKWRLWGDNQIDPLEQKGFHQALQDCLKNLPMTQRSVVMLRTLEGLSIEQVCKDLELTSSNVGVLLFRARLSLRRCLSANWYEKR